MTPLDIPGVKEAIEREKFLRNAAFILDAVDVAQFKLRCMTLKDMIRLEVIHHPLVTGGEVSTFDLACFLWLMCEDYNEAGAGRKKFMRQCRKLFFPTSPLLFRGPFWKARELTKAHNYVTILTSVKQYVEDQFFDAPGQSQAQFLPSYYSDGTFWCALLSREYGWHIDQVMNCKLQIMFQFRNEWRQRNGLPVGNPSDRIANEYLAKINENPS